MCGPHAPNYDRPEQREGRSSRGAGGSTSPCHDVDGGDRGKPQVTITRAEVGLVISPFPAFLLATLAYEHRTRARGSWRREILKNYRQVGPSELWVPSGLLVRVTNLLAGAGCEIVQEMLVPPAVVPDSARPLLQCLAPTLQRRVERLLATPTGGELPVGYEESVEVIVALARALHGRRTLVITARLDRAAQLRQAAADSGTWPGLFCRDVQDMEDLSIVTGPC